MSKIGFTVILSLFMFSQLVYSQDGTLQLCQSLKSNIVSYEKLRKKGGSARRMESWRQSKKNFRKKFDDNGCKKWRKKLK
ncbi:MAG: hypothetical protein V3U75_07300 [Methylococcaceae bacterium]